MPQEIRARASAQTQSMHRTKRARQFDVGCQTSIAFSSDSLLMAECAGWLPYLLAVKRSSGVHSSTLASTANIRECDRMVERPPFEQQSWWVGRDLATFILHEEAAGHGIVEVRPE